MKLERGLDEEDEDEQKTPAPPDVQDVMISTEMSVKALNYFRNNDMLTSFLLLDHSPEVKELKMDQLECNPLGSLFLKVMERKLEALQWQIFQHLQVGDEHITLNVSGAKKDQLRVNLPLNGSSMCLPFAGNINMCQQSGTSGAAVGSSAAKTTSHLFTTLFGVHFYVHGKHADVQSMDLVVLAWAAKPVAKAADAFFKQESKTVAFLVLRHAGQSPLDCSFYLSTETNSEELTALSENCVNAGGAACFWVCDLDLEVCYILIF